MSILSMYEITPDITVKYILERVSQEDIFSHYLGVPITYKNFFCSPLRSDKNPTCSFKKLDSGVVLFRDWAEQKPLSCFQLVQELYQCNIQYALHHINKDMILEKKRPIYNFVENTKQKDKKSTKSIIQVKFGKFEYEVKDYLKGYGLTTKSCKKFNIFPIKNVFLNGKLFWSYSKYDPALGYYFGDNNGEQRWKIYFFKRKSKYRFLCNTNRINGWVQLPQSGDTLVITKSLKDVACLDLFGIPAISMQNETTLPYDYIIEEMKSRFTNIYSLYDYDTTGISLATQLEELYNIKPLFFKNINNVKDFSDYLKHNGHIKTQKLINYVKKNLENTRKFN
jgi:hypothetical protein